MVNASVEFNIETLSPTYKLSIGLPGRSNALAIANRLGLDERVIERSREFLGTAGVRMENLLEGLQSERKAAEDEHFQLSMERTEAEYQRRQIGGGTSSSWRRIVSEFSMRRVLRRGAK